MSCCTVAVIHFNRSPLHHGINRNNGYRVVGCRAAGMKECGVAALAGKTVLEVKSAGGVLRNRISAVPPLPPPWIASCSGTRDCLPSTSSSPSSSTAPAPAPDSTAPAQHSTRRQRQQLSTEHARPRIKGSSTSSRQHSSRQHQHQHQQQAAPAPAPAPARPAIHGPR